MEWLSGNKLTYHFCRQFHPYCFFHAPFKEEENDRYDKHFDAFVYDEKEGIAIIVEAKRLFNPSKLKSLINDCDRINQNLGNLEHDTGIASILSRFENGHKIRVDRRRIFSLILTEVWQENISAWWKLSRRDFERKRQRGEVSGRRNWDAWHKNYEEYKKGILSKYDYFHSEKVFDKLSGIDGPLFCCYAYKRILRIP